MESVKALCEIAYDTTIANTVMFLNPVLYQKSRLHSNPLQQSTSMKQMGHAYDAELAVPIMLEKKLLGILFVGKKRSEEPYEKIDIDLLENFSSQIAVALEKALLYKQVAEHSVLLERRVTERTHEIHVLQQAEQQMMLDISHGLQTPLTIIKNELGKIKSHSPKLGELATFEKSIDKASKFVYDLLRLAHLDTIHNEAYEVVNFSGLLSEVVEYFEIPANEQRIAVHTMIEPSARIRGEKEELTEAISNLLSNAVKYMREDGERNIFISLAVRHELVLLTIRDTGIGISSEDIPHLFERFYRVKQRNKTKGTGLGLSITKQIIARHGGTIAVESTVDHGSSFIISLPQMSAASSDTTTTETVA